METLYDVIVVGGGTAGCAVSYMSAKLGLKVLLIERGIHLGGTITSGLVVPAMMGGHHQINTEFFNILISELKKVGGQVTYMGNQGWFNPELLKIVLDIMMNDVGVEVRFNAEVKDVKTDKNNVVSVEINKEILSIYNEEVDTDNINKNYKPLSVYIDAKYFVDATGNCDFANQINCTFLKMESDYQPMSLRFIMGGIDLKTFGDWILNLDSDRNVTTVQNIDGQIHLSTAYTWDSDKHWALAPLFDKAVADGVLKDTDRNYFQIFTVVGMPDSVAFNCPRIAETLNPNLVKDTTKALMQARESIFRLAKFCKKYLKGFENAYISNIADMLGIRVSNRIKGKYLYTIEDLRSGKKFQHPVLISNYPVDVHSKDKNSSTLTMTGEYQLPIESLISYDYDNLLVVGRGISADYMAQGALRVQTSCFSMGEAAARYMAAKITNNDVES